MMMTTMKMTIATTMRTTMMIDDDAYERDKVGNYDNKEEGKKNGDDEDVIMIQKPSSHSQSSLNPCFNLNPIIT